MAQHFRANSQGGWLHLHLSTEICSHPGGTRAELLKSERHSDLKSGVFTAEAVYEIDQYTSSTTATCLHGTRGIALIQHLNKRATYQAGYTWE